MKPKVFGRRIDLIFSISIIIAFNKISSIASIADTGFYTTRKETRQIKSSANQQQSDINDVVPTRSASQTECILTCRRQHATDIFYVEEENNCYCIVNKKNSNLVERGNENSNLFPPRSVDGNSFKERNVR